MKPYIYLLLIVSFIIYACDPFHTQFKTGKDYVITYSANKNIPPNNISDTLLVMTWNIKFGGGRIDFFWDCYGDAAIMNEPEVIENLKGIAAKINLNDPDIIFLQEVDISSKRSAYIDQVQWLLDHSSFNHAVYASSWKADYIASDGLGKINSGNAILSKWPLTDAERIALPLRTDQAPHVKYFYLQRNILKAKFETHNQTINLVNLHAAAYATDNTKKEHIDIMFSELESIHIEGQYFVGGGDFNMVPPSTLLLKNYNDLPCDSNDYPHDNFSGQAHWMNLYYENFTPAISTAEYDEENRSHYTFTADKNGFWNRKLDHLFTNMDKVTSSGLTHIDSMYGGMKTMPLSDHAPVSFEVIVR